MSIADARADEAPTRRLAPVRPRSRADIRKTGSHPDFWYPLARSKDLKTGKPLAVRFAGEPIVLVRPEKGPVFALENRCAHRQVPLDKGVVDGEHLMCGYHGWRYDAGGRCVTIPYLDDARQCANKVKSYPVREAYGFVFVFPGEKEKAATVNFPDVPTYADPNYKTRVLDRDVGCHYTFMHENLMDMNHQFLHRRLMGRIKTIFLEVRRAAENRVEVDYTFARVGGKQPFGERFMINRAGPSPDANSAGDGNADRDLMTITTEYPYQSLKFWTAGSEEPALDLWNIYVPQDAAQRTNHTFGLMMIRKPPIPGLVHLFWPAIIWFTEGIFREDREIVEMEQAAFDAQGADHNNEVFPAINELRDVLIKGGVPLG